MVKKFFIGTFGVCVNVIIYALVIIFAVRMVTFAYDFSYEIFGNTVVEESSEKVVPIQISEGASTDEIATLLEKKGLIKYKYAFIIHVALSQYKGQIQAGNYELSPSMNMDEMLAIMSGHGETLTE